MTGAVVHQGDGPVVLGMPHTGTWTPPEVWRDLNERGRALADTDWHVDALYDGLLPEATSVRADFHRYVVDANRPPDGKSLYPGQNTTGLVPLTDFDGAPIWDRPPDDQAIRKRCDAYHRPYHETLAAELARVRDRNGIAILFDCHSIRSVVPHLFKGTLPDLNIGTDGGVTCDWEIEAAALRLAQESPFSTVLNGRFRGGWTTRNYGQPADGIHAIQMEIAQATYLAEEAAPWSYDVEKAGRLRAALGAILASLEALAKDLAR